MSEYLAVLEQRRNYLAGRIEAKKAVGWETQWDEREKAALTWAIEKLQSADVAEL